MLLELIKSNSVLTPWVVYPFVRYFIPDNVAPVMDKIILWSPFALYLGGNLVQNFININLEINKVIPDNIIDPELLADE